MAWSDIITRDRRALDAEIFRDGRHPLMMVSAYANHLHAAMLILQSGFAVVPLPQEYVASQSLSFEVRRLDSVFRPYQLSIEAVGRDDIVRASAPATYFIAAIKRTGRQPRGVA